MSIPQFSLVLAIALSLPAVARTWTNSEGRAIEADFVSADEPTPFLPLSDLLNKVLRDTPQKANS
jgi:hypothetical protein